MAAPAGRRTTPIHVRVICAALCMMIAATMPAHARAQPDSVDLGPNQTALRKQGSRGTCIVFASTAALEAAYHRAGYGELDLSEEFLNHFGKMFWLEPDSHKLEERSADGREGQVGAFAGGDGVQYLEELANGVRVPTESAMPYHPRNFTAADHPYLANAWNAPFWTQRRADDVNFDVSSSSACCADPASLLLGAAVRPPRRSGYARHRGGARPRQ